MRSNKILRDISAMAKDRLNITIEEDVSKWVKDKAEQERRTISNFIEYVLWQAMEADQESEEKK